MSDSALHRLLKRQLQRTLDASLHDDPKLQDFIRSVNSAYAAFESDIAHSESILEQSHRELYQINQQLLERAEKSELAAQKVRDELERVLNNINEIIFQTDRNGKWSYLNQAWTKVTGYAIDEALHHYAWSLLEFEDQRQIEVEFAEMMEGRLSYYENRYQYKDASGKFRWIHLRARPLQNEANEIVGTVGTLNDITDKYEAEQQGERLSLVARKTANLVVITDAHGRISWVNRAFERITGYELNEVMGKIPGSFLQGPDTDPKTKAKIREAIHNRESYNGLILNYTKSGKPYWLRIAMDPILGDLGELQGSIAIESEVTEEVQIREEIERSRTFLETLLQNIPDAICALDGQLRIVMANQVFTENFKLFYKGEVRIGDRLEDVIVKDWELWESFMHEARFKPMRQVQTTIGNDGRQYSFEVQALPIQLSNHETGVLILGRDISLETKQKQELEKNKGQLEKAQEIARLGSFRIGRNGWVEVSEQLREMLQMSGAKERIEPFAERLFPDSPGLLLKLATAAQSSNGMRRMEHQIALPTGKTIDLNTVLMQAEGADDHSYHAWGICLDITRHKNDQRALQNSNNKLESINKELDRFAYIISHDLKTPLRAIYNLSLFIEDDLINGQTADAQANLSTLKERAEFMEKLIEGVLAYSRAGRVSSLPTKVNTHTLINELIQSIKTQRAVAVSLQGNWHTVLTEEIPLVQVLSNLIGNAAKYTDAEVLQLELGQRWQIENEVLEFWIKDNGPGIPPELQSKVLELFQTLHKPGEKEKGSGIGLALVQRIVSERGGQLQIESDGVNGSLFRFTWPLMKQNELG